MLFLPIKLNIVIFISDVNAQQSDGMSCLMWVLILHSYASREVEPIIGTFSYLFIHDLVVLWVHLKVNSLLFNWEDFLMESAKLYRKMGLDVDRIEA